jgi:hypothetical protein
MPKRTLAAAVTLALLILGGAFVPAQAATGDQWFDDLASATISVSGQQYVDGHGREVVLRGFNVSGEVKLAENNEEPFASTADAVASATAMRQQTGANTVRLLLSWAAAQPAPGTISTTYLSGFAGMLRAFLDRGFTVFLDYHQDLYSRYLFNTGSWYTGDGAPAWVVAAGGYPAESCGICVNWGQNITQNAAVDDAMYDFWHDRVLTTSSGQVGVQDAFLSQAQSVLTYLKGNLTTAEFARIAGVDPWNEPYAGTYDSGQTSLTWERDLLWPFYTRFRARMDAAGWTGKAAFVEPNLFWNANLSFEQQSGGLTNIGTPGSRYVFNSHFYDEAALSGVFMIGKAGDGQYVSNFATIRQRAAALGTTAMLSEFGSPVTGYTSDKTPTVLKAMYQAMNSTLTGANWWSQAASSGTLLSGTQWHWDIYSGRHDELMNGNPDKVETTGDAWNGEDYSQVSMTTAGVTTLREDSRVLDQAYPLAVAGHTLAFTYEDRSRDGSTTLTWTPVPSSLPAVSTIVGSGQYAVLVWRDSGSAYPTEVHLPASFTAAGTTVISDLGRLTGLPAYATGTPISVAAQAGGAGGNRLILTGTGTSGAIHYALLTNGSTTTTASALATAKTELAAWAAAQSFS